ncbi:MAG: aminotransferase class I/II-fold pyridoxal phosphate-dependent enzyme [Christensenellaceae bacterium]|nr:aminotransferase class I/II-fold pyridoxal phosphate-dependent enzyme [Christensenellaceae bacterium]
MKNWYEMFCQNSLQNGAFDYTSLVSQSDSISDGINHLGTPELYRKLIAEEIMQGIRISGYSQSSGHPLLTYGIGMYERILAGEEPENSCFCAHVCVTVGATAAIKSLFSYFAEGKGINDVMCLGMNYYLFAVCAQRYNMRLSNLLGEHTIAPNLQQIVCEIPKHKGGLLILTQPMNPSGEQYCESELIQIFSMCKNYDYTVILDLCQMDELNPYGTEVNIGRAILTSGAENTVVIVNSFSKIRSLAGMRLGYLATNDKKLAKYATYLNEINSFNHTLGCENAVIVDLFYRTILRSVEASHKSTVRLFRNLILQTAGESIYQRVFRKLLKSESLFEDATNFQKEIASQWKIVRKNYEFCKQKLLLGTASRITPLSGGYNFCVRFPLSLGQSETEWAQMIGRSIGSNVLTQQNFCVKMEKNSKNVWLRLSAAMESNRFQGYISKLV